MTKNIQIVKGALDDFASQIGSSNSLTTWASEMFGVSPETFINWHWQMNQQIRTKDQAEKIFPLTAQEIQGFSELAHLFHAGVTPYYAALGLRTNSLAVRLQALPSVEELADAYGHKDPLDEVGHSPVKEVVHVYPDRVAFCVAQLCPVYCRYCFRKRRDGEKGLHFNPQIVERGIAYIASNPAIKDVLVTGGDPFIASDGAIESLLQKIRSIKHVEVIRFGTRTPVTLPYRVTSKLAQTIAKYHPIWLNTHFNCAEELTEEAAQAIDHLTRAGIPVGNQAVLLRGVNDSSEKMMELCRKLVRFRVRPYYVFQPHLVAGTEHLRVSVKEGLKIMESLRGNISGYAIPTYALDTPSGKVPLGRNHILGTDGKDLILEDIRGEIWREKGAYF